jgi:hypothetical protein
MTRQKWMPVPHRLQLPRHRKVGKRFRAAVQAEPPTGFCRRQPPRLQPETTCTRLVYMPLVCRGCG